MSEKIEPLIFNTIEVGFNNQPKRTYKVISMKHVNVKSDNPFIRVRAKSLLSNIEVTFKLYNTHEQ